MNLQRIFIENLKKFRKEQNITQAKLAEMTGLSTGMIGQIESGIAFPSIVSLEKICRALKIDAYKFFVDPTQKLPITDVVLEEMINEIRLTMQKYRIKSGS